MKLTRFGIILVLLSTIFISFYLYRGYQHYQLNSVLDVDANIDNYNWIRANNSSTFNLSAQVFIRPLENANSAQVVYNIKLENKTNDRIDKVNAVAYLDKSLQRYVSTRNLSISSGSILVQLAPTNSEAIDRETKGLSIGNDFGIVGYKEFNVQELNELLNVLKSPIKVKISFNEGYTEFLQIDSDKISIIIQERV